MLLFLLAVLNLGQGLLIKNDLTRNPLITSSYLDIFIKVSTSTIGAYMDPKDCHFLLFKIFLKFYLSYLYSLATFG